MLTIGIDRGNKFIFVRLIKVHLDTPPASRSQLKPSRPPINFLEGSLDETRVDFNSPFNLHNASVRASKG